MLDAVEFAASNQLSVFDAAIVCAAARAECSELLTEDLTHDRQYAGVTVNNPFASLPAD
jgi:predicted nucleic acid-binding protein